MRELKEIFGTVSDMKSGKEIEKGYQNLVSTYQAFYEKAKQMQEEAEKNLSLERILNFTKTFLVPQRGRASAGILEAGYNEVRKETGSREGFYYCIRECTGPFDGKVS